MMISPASWAALSAVSSSSEKLFCVATVDFTFLLPLSGNVCGLSLTRPGLGGARVRNDAYDRREQRKSRARRAGDEPHHPFPPRAPREPVSVAQLWRKQSGRYEAEQRREGLQKPRSGMKDRPAQIARRGADRDRVGFDHRSHVLAELLERIGQRRRRHSQQNPQPFGLPIIVAL